MRWLLGIRVVVEGELPQTGAIVAFKHESMLETTEVLRLFDRPAVVFKAELLRIPLWGSAAVAHGVIPVARETGATALRRMLKAGREAIAEARPVIIFPEGTRVPHGEKAPLRPGVAGLYKALNLPVVPVALDSGRLWHRRNFVKHAGIVTFRVGEVIPTGLPREEVESRIHAGINALNL
jgi:1-acyl-sn-glycerol-3-phosphate acyltransferase